MKIFLSSALADREWTDALTTSLRSEGVEVTGPAEGLPESQWEGSLRQWLDAADIVIPVLTERSSRNPELLFELGAALGADKQIFCLLVTTEGKPIQLPPLLKDRPLAKVTTPQEAAERVRQYASGLLAAA